LLKEVFSAISEGLSPSPNNRSSFKGVSEDRYLSKNLAMILFDLIFTWELAKTGLVSVATTKKSSPFF
jgi:hypothetical protein